MSKLASIRKQIAALEAEAERIARQEMSGAIAKVEEIMAEFGLTIEHLQSAVGGKTRKVAKKVKAKRIGGGIAKYADPKTGKTWSGFGRACLDPGRQEPRCVPGRQEQCQTVRGASREEEVRDEKGIRQEVGEACREEDIGCGQDGRSADEEEPLGQEVCPEARCEEVREEEGNA